MLQALIEKCPQDLNLFAVHVVNILAKVVSSNDLTLCQHASPVFESFCKFHDGALFSGDPEYVKDFQLLVQAYVGLASGAAQGPNSLEWKLVGLQAINSFTASVVMLTPVGTTNMKTIIPLLLSSLTLDNDGSATILLDSQINAIESKRDNRRISLPMITAIPEEIMTDQRIPYTSMLGLRHFFETTSISLIRGATSHIVTYVLNNNSHFLWSATLLEIVTKCAPVQSRFSVLSELVDTLTSLSQAKVSDQLVVANLMSSLLSSSVNMIGLSVIDILKSILHTQSQALKLFDTARAEKGTPISDLIKALKECVIALASHIYYNTQISDIVYELLSKCEPSKGFRAHPGTFKDQGSFYSEDSKHVSTAFLINALETIADIFSMSHVKVGGVEHSELSISSWDGTQNFLNHENQQVRYAYARALVLYLLNQKASSDKSFRVTHDFDPSEGFYGRILNELARLATNSSAKNADFVIVYQVAYGFITFLGTQGIARATALAFYLENESAQILSGQNINEHTVDHGLALTNVAYAILYRVAKSLSSESTAARLSKEIESRQSSGLWDTKIDVDKSLLDLLKQNTHTTYDYDQSNASQIQSLDRSVILSEFTGRLQGFELTMSHIFDTNLLAVRDRHTYQPPQIPSNSSYNSPQLSRARSLNQLNKHFGNGGNHIASSMYQSNNNTTTSIAGTSEHHSRLGSDGNEFLNTAGNEGHRNFSPRVQDLKNVASGRSIRTVSSSHKLRNDYTFSIATGADVQQQLDGSSHVASPALGTKTGQLDVMSFLSSLTVSDNKGRLV